jgi:ABC-2 type transport system permease protein
VIAPPAAGPAGSLGGLGAGAVLLGAGAGLKGVRDIVPVLIVALVLRFVLLRRRRRPAPAGRAPEPVGARRQPSLLERALGGTGIVAEREIRDRFRGRIFRIGTLVILIVVVAAISIPALRRSSSPATEQAGVVGTLAAPLRAAATGVAPGLGITIALVAEPDLAAAQAALRSGKLAFAIVGGTRIVVDKAIGPGGTSTAAQLVRVVAKTLGDDEAVAAAGLTPAQAGELAAAKPLPVTALASAASTATRTTSLFGLPVLLFMFMIYNTWILLGVMEEKASRVVEVLLSAVRPIELLAGKVLGIGVVALTQAALILGVALLDARAVGSNLIRGSTPVFLVSVLAWLLLGYAFYCWVYAAAGSMAERRDQVQTLSVPLTVPILLGYIVALTAQSTATPSTLLRVFAYLPPTAPFAMPALVSLNAVSLWQFVASALISLAATAIVARLAAQVYRRAVLRTGRRVHVRELLARPAR